MRLQNCRRFFLFQTTKNNNIHLEVNYNVACPIFIFFSQKFIFVNFFASSFYICSKAYAYACIKLDVFNIFI